MAEPGRTVRVSGLPTDVEEERLRDKLLIHFLRARNGGGEIDSVTIVKATPASALVTFEDSGVAQRVIQHGRHSVEVNGRKYRVTVTEHQQGLDPDKVVCSLSAAVDYSQLPGGKAALTGLHKIHPGVRINYNAAERLCTLQGSFSKVQAALAQLLQHPEDLQLGDSKDSSPPAAGGSRPVQADQETEDQRKRPKKQREDKEKVHAVRHPHEYDSSSYRDLTPGGHSWEDTEGAALRLPGSPSSSEEDFSLILDADMFQYLQKRCQEEYLRILSRYGVDVVDETSQGVTTLFLQLRTGGGRGGGGQDEEWLKSAKKAIGQLYQENESKIRRAQLPKNILSPRGGLRRAMESLGLRFPKLLLNEDETHIYFIGSESDLSDAKQFLLLDLGKKEDVASLLRFPSYESGAAAHVPLTLSPPGDPLDKWTDPLPRSEEDKGGAEGAKRYKLAARFQDTAMASLGNRPTDFTLRGPARQTRPGPMLGHDVLSETSSAQNTGGDILFRSADVSTQSKTSSHLSDTRPKTATPPFSTTQASLFGGAVLPPAGSGSSLRRSSSFSGTAQQKAQVTGQKSQDDSSSNHKSTTNRARSSSFSNKTTGRDKQEVHTAEITVSFLMWTHIKEAYHTRIEDLTSDVQLRENSIKGSDHVVTIRGADSAKVTSCQVALQRLIDTVNADFSVNELPLKELGITDRDDENLKACCDEVRSRFRKVTMHTTKTSLFLLGPKELCSQVGASLREIFSIQIPENSSYPSTSNCSPSTYLQNEDQSRSTHGYSSLQGMLETHTGIAGGAGVIQERRPNHRSDAHEAGLVNGSISRKDPVVKEKVKIVGTKEKDETLGNEKSANLSNGFGSTSTLPEKKERTTHQECPQEGQAGIQVSADGPGSSLGGQGCLCVCGKSEKLTMTKCQVALCPQCHDTVHAHCKVCKEMEETPRGIVGKMKSSKLTNIQIHGSSSAIKITYSIPDGIQGDGDPSPGSPFKGGLFEAYLPDCDQAKKLLPRLQKAFKQGLTFTLVRDQESGGARVDWDGIPHKTSLQGGKSGKGYPDSSYLNRLSGVLKSLGIYETPAKS